MIRLVSAIAAMLMVAQGSVSAQKGAISTNLLYDGLMIPSLSGELYLGDEWSVVGQVVYSWWGGAAQCRHKKTYGGVVEARHYFRPGTYTGHHVGVYGQWLSYNFKCGYTGYESVGLNYAGGLAYGYTLPITRRLDVDFTVGFGYVLGKYRKFATPDGYTQLTGRSKPFNMVLPTRVEVSLVYRL